MLFKVNGFGLAGQKRPHQRIDARNEIVAQPGKLAGQTRPEQFLDNRPALLQLQNAGALQRAGNVYGGEQSAAGAAVNHERERRRRDPATPAKIEGVFARSH